MWISKSTSFLKFEINKGKKGQEKKIQKKKKPENITNDKSENHYSNDFFEYGKIFLTSLPERDVTFCDK